MDLRQGVVLFKEMVDGTGVSKDFIYQLNDLNGAQQEKTIAFILYHVSKFIFTCISLDKTVSHEIALSGSYVEARLKGNLERVSKFICTC